MAAYEDRKLFNINAAREQPFFFGKIIYETVFEADAIDAAGTKPGCIRLSLGEVQEACEVFVNDIPAGLKKAEPYVFDIGHAVCAGENRLKIIVQNNLAHKKKKINMQALFEAGSATGYTTLPRGGLLGPVTLNG